MFREERDDAGDLIQGTLEMLVLKALLRGPTARSATKIQDRDSATCLQRAPVDLTGQTTFGQAGMFHSVRSALIGSIDAARRAGTKQAARATDISTTQTHAITTGSIGLTLKSN